MGKINNTDQNDNRFNAVSGLLNNNPTEGKKTSLKKHPDGLSRSYLIDDFLPHPKTPAAITTPSKTLADDDHRVLPEKKPKTIGGRKIHPALAHQPEHSHTLMRSGLPKPAAKEHVAHVQTSLNHKTSHLIGPHERLHRLELGHAQDIQRDYRVSRFGKNAPTVDNFSLKMQLMPVKVPVYGKGVGVGSDNENEKPPATEIEKHHRAVSSRYKKQRKARRLHRRLTFIVIIAVLLVLLAYFIIQLVPAIDVKVASIHAGIPAQLPSYHPIDYAFNEPVKYSNGIVNINFKSKSSERTYSVVQQATQWNNQVLRNDYVSTLNEPYTTVSSNNQTIYLYGTGQAAWISKGILFQISGSADLPEAQILNIANSI